MTPVPFRPANPALTGDGISQDENGIPFMDSADQRTGTGNAPYLDRPKLNSEIVICDLDGTVAIPFPGRSMYTTTEVHKDAKCKSLANIIEGLYHQGFTVYMISARSAMELAKQEGYDKERVRLLMEEYGEATGLTTTFHWLREHFIPFDRLILRPDIQNKQDIFMKQDIFKSFIKDPDKVYCAFDDNGPIVKLWRSYGICTYQVAPGWDKRPLKEDAVEMLETNKADPKRWC